jgi:hypothetical protein
VAAYSTVETLRHPFNVIAFQAFIDIVARRCGTLRKCCHTFRAPATSLAGLDGSQCCCHPARLAVRMLAHYGSETRMRSYRTANGKLYLGGSVCPLLAQSGDAEKRNLCRYSGKRTWLVQCKCLLMTQSRHSSFGLIRVLIERPSSGKPTNYDPGVSHFTSDSPPQSYMPVMVPFPDFAGGVASL